jgi:hypothetical protein
MGRGLELSRLRLFTVALFSERRRHRHRGGRSLARSSFLLLHFPLSRKSEKSFGNDGGSSDSTRGEAVWTLVFRRH